MLVLPIPATLASSAPAGITGTSMSCAQILQSKTFLPLFFDSPEALVDSVEDDDASRAVVEGESGEVDVVTLRGIVAPSSSSLRIG